jgi:hypothetical protein
LRIRNGGGDSIISKVPGDHVENAGAGTFVR